MNNQAPSYFDFLEREKMIRSKQPLTKGEQESGIDKYNNLEEYVFTGRE